MPVLYEKLPDFYFYCVHIGHQYMECLKYKGQPKDQLPYGGWMRAITQAEKTKQSQIKEKGKQDQSQLRVSTMVANPDKTGNKIGNMVEPKCISHGPENDDTSLMLSTEKPKNLNLEVQEEYREISNGQNKRADNDNAHRNNNLRAGKDIWRENEAREGSQKTLITGYQIQMMKK